MEYQDFTVDVRSAGRGRFEARVVAAPFRDTPQVFFAEPIARETLEALASAFDRPGAEIRKKGLPAELSPHMLGGQLYSALFRGELAELFQSCRDTCVRDRESGLRLRLRFRPSDEEAEYLAALPWEWLWDPKSAEFLATDLGTPVVRDLAARRPHGVLEVDPPLRILVVDAAPKTLEKLDLKLEIERIAEALSSFAERGRVELLRLETATPEQLREVLQNPDLEIHILHFMGHGGYDPRSGMGAVIFETPDGKEDHVDGEMLAAYLKRTLGPRLVVLNACKTARQAGRLGAPLYYGLPVLVERTGVAALVANQFSISDPAAVDFSTIFYGRIAAGDGVDEALTEVRLRLKERTPEWATPVLFLASANGRLLPREPAQPKPSARVERIVHVALRRPEAEPVRLGVRSIVGWGADMEERNDEVLDLVQYFDGRYIKEKAWWQEKVFPDLRSFLRRLVQERRPLLLDFAAHSSIAFAAGWLLEPKSGLDVRVRQRTGSEGEFEWSPTDGREPEGELWLERPDVDLGTKAPDVAAVLSVSQPAVAEEVGEFIRRQGCPIGRIVDAVIAPEPGPRSVRGGAHALRLAQALLPRLRRRYPHEREGCVHFFCSAPNALVFYLGQLASSLESIVLYEYPFRAPGAYGRYQKSIELPPPGEVERVPEGW